MKLLFFGFSEVNSFSRNTSNLFLGKKENEDPFDTVSHTIFAEKLQHHAGHSLKKGEEEIIISPSGGQISDWIAVEK